ncbi:SIR2 family protein [Paracoccus liaowanqingii]|nr:SIR2 family protein [Paracoccus liaowanqingii]
MIEQIQEYSQGVLSLAPAIVLGSGFSAAHGVPGMWPLGRHLRDLDIDPTWDSEETTQWAAFSDQIDVGVDLEAALGRARLSDRQTAKVVEATRTFLMPADLQAFNEMLADRKTFPLSRLYQHLFNSTHRTVDVVTTNYDRLAEYAADAGGFSHFTGFDYGHLQIRARDPRTRVHYGRDVARTVCVWKVHGSLDWFQDSFGQIIGARACLETPPTYAPVMVTPGIDKYRLTHGEPFRTIFGCSDAALQCARAYLCIGYGFNDEHVQPKLIERCETTAAPLLVLTKELTPTTKSFLARGRCGKYLALEEYAGGTRAYNTDNPNGIEIPGTAIWSLPNFLNCMLGDTT